MSLVGTPDERSAQLVLELSVGRLPRSLAFYEAVGFELERQTATFAVLSWAGQRLFLVEHSHAAPGHPPPNLRIIVENVDAWHAKAQANGWNIRSPLADQPYGLRDFTIADPDGYELRFATPI